MEKFDLVVIGGGPSGYAAAMRAVDFGKKVALVEKGKLGGAGVLKGALWSKTWWEISRRAATLREHGSTYNTPRVHFNFHNIKEDVNRAMEERIELLTHHLENINVSVEGNLFDLVRGKGRVKEKHLVEVETDTGIRQLHTDHIVLATGSTPRKLPHLPIDEKIVLTSDGLPDIEGFPKSIVILGAGVIGCEFATIFSGFGQTKVHLIDKGDRILPFEDEDLVAVVEKNLEGRNVLIHRNSQLKSMEIENGEVKYTLEYNDGSKEIFRVEKALISVGRVPNYQDLIDESVGIEMDDRGIKDNLTQTSISNIYAVGDITADISLVNVGELEGRYAVERMFGKPDRDLVYENISTIMFLSPEVAGVGMNEQQAVKAGINFRVVSLDYSCIPRATAMLNTNGFIKMIVSNDDQMKILGMRVIGEHASSAIQAVALLIYTDKGIRELSELIHPHPSIIEGIQECCRMLLGTSIFKPSVLRQAMVCKVFENGAYRNLH